MNSHFIRKRSLNSLHAVYQKRLFSLEPKGKRLINAIKGTNGIYGVSSNFLSSKIEDNKKCTKEFPFTGMEINFLGTSAGTPTAYRNATSIGMRLEGENWLFDCGEGTLLQLMFSSIRIPSINNIFITHLHGDHIFGLPGLICSLNAHQSNVSSLPIDNSKLTIYGPVGLFNFINTSLMVSSGNLPQLEVEVNELLTQRDISMINSQSRERIQQHRCLTRKEIHSTIVNGVEQWDLLDDGNRTVKATSIRHTIQCYGYVIEEHPFPGKFNVEKARERGLRPGPAYADLVAGNPVELPDGSILHPKEVVAESEQGRKVVILGDTCNADNIVSLARNADVLVHESTIPKSLSSKAYARGHSTADMAGSFARKIQARMLLLTHFSGRTWSQRDIAEYVRHAQNTFKNRNVFAAYDFLRVPILRKSASHSLSPELLESINSSLIPTVSPNEFER